MPVLALLLLLISGQANAASRVWIAEFATARIEAAAPIAQLPAVAKQTLDLASGVAQRSVAFTNSTRYIRVVCEVQCALSASSNATTSDLLLPAMRPEYFGVTAGAIITLIAAPSVP